MYDLSFFVPGAPVTKGSTEAVPARGRGGKVYIRATNKGPQDEWAGYVAQAARTAVRMAWTNEANLVGTRPHPGPVECVTHFVCPVLPEGRKTPRKLATEHSVGDLDKLVRCVWDALTGVVWVDDAQVVSGSMSKRLADPVIGEQPGVMISVRLLGEP